MATIPRSALGQVLGLLAHVPVVAIHGARQVGKTTLSRLVAAKWPGPVHLFDLEDPAHQARLSEPGLVLRKLLGLVVLDGIQLRPDLFPLLRVLVDRKPNPTRFLLLGSAAPQLVRPTSERLAGRVAILNLAGLSLAEIGTEAATQLWMRGGFPRSFLAADEDESVR